MQGSYGVLSLWMQTTAGQLSVLSVSVVVLGQSVVTVAFLRVSCVDPVTGKCVQTRTGTHAHKHT